jgi:hypothetical protein
LLTQRELEQISVARAKWEKGSSCCESENIVLTRAVFECL